MLNSASFATTHANSVFNLLLYSGRFSRNSVIDWPTKPAKRKPNTTISSITNVIESHLGTPNFEVQRIIGLHAIAIKTERKNGTMIALAAFTPAITTTKHAKTIRIFAVGERSSIDILCYIPD